MAAECKLKLVTLGESGVGKTSLVTRFTRRIFKENMALTIIDCFHHKIELRGIPVTLEIWDTAGQERFRSIVRNYYRDVDGVLLFYDVTNITTFHKLSSWLLELKQLNDTAIPVIVGNKCDAVGANSVSIGCVQSFAEAENMEFFEASAKTGKNVNEIFEHLTLKILEAKQIAPAAGGATPPEIPPSHQQQANSSKTSAETKFVSTEKKTPGPVFEKCDFQMIPARDSIILHSRPIETAPEKKKKCC